MLAIPSYRVSQGQPRGGDVSQWSLRHLQNPPPLRSRGAMRFVLSYKTIQSEKWAVWEVVGRSYAHPNNMLTFRTYVRLGVICDGCERGTLCAGVYGLAHEWDDLGLGVRGGRGTGRQSCARVGMYGSSGRGDLRQGARIWLKWTFTRFC
jgi:hypothetical protein